MLPALFLRNVPGSLALEDEQSSKRFVQQDGLSEGPWAIASLIDVNVPFRLCTTTHLYWGGNIHVPTDHSDLGVNATSTHQTATPQFEERLASLSDINAGEALPVMNAIRFI